MNYRDFGKRINKRRLELGLTEQEVVNKMTGVSIHKYVKWESGDTKEFLIEDIAQLKNGLDCSLDYLIVGCALPEVINNAIKSGINADDIQTIINIIKKYRGTK